MNLIDILNQILQTKNQIKDIISESDDFSRYSTSIHNYLADIYNAGYVEGYSEKYEEEIGVPSYPEDPVKHKDYSSESENYDPFTSDGLIDIMSDVLGYRLDIKDELGTESDYFPSYPEYLSAIINSLYNTAKNDGADAASEDISPAIVPTTPSFSFSDNVFTLTPVEGEESVNIYYKIGADGVPIRYTSPVTISGDVEIYYWASVGKAKSSEGYSTLSFNPQIISDLELYPPYIYTENNTVYIKGDTNSETILYKIENGDYQVYYGPFPISEDTTITAVSIKNNVISSENTVICKYIDPDEEPLPKCEKVDLIQNTDNTIEMSCSTNGATIHYKIDDGSWNTYSSSFIISNRCIIYVYSSKNDYRDSDVIYYPITPYVINNPPADPTFYTAYGGTCYVSCSTAGAHIFYRIGDVGEYTEVSSNNTRLYPSNDCRIYAFSRKDNLYSDVIVYDYTYTSTYFNLNPPTVELINNRIVISSENTVWYTLDGRDPRVYGITYVPKSDGFSGIGISGTTTIRAIAVDSDENYRDHFSSEVTKTFTPIDAGMEGYIPNNDFFNVRGASEIHLSGTAGFREYDLSYSYDKRDWIAFKNDVTGLDPNKIVYLQTYGTDSYKVFESISFGENDRVTVAGNILSVVMNGDHTVYEDALREMTLYKFFYNCTQLVDAKELCIPYKSLKGNDMQYMFYGCIRLENGPSNFYFTEVSDFGLYQTFYGCDNLRSVGSFNITKIGEQGMYETFKGCTHLIDFNKMDLVEVGKRGMEGCFEGCYGLVKASVNIGGNVGNSSFKNCFKDCTSLKNRSWINSNSYIDNINISASEIDWYSFQGCFNGCRSLDYFGILPAQEGKYHCYERMFSGCSSLKEVGSLGLLSTDEYCCAEMFSGCSSLEKAPELLSHSLRLHAYERMFYGCSSLNYIKALFLTTPESAVTKEWVYGVAAEGTFIQDSDALWFEESVNAIPPGWTIPLDANRPGEIIEISTNYDYVTIIANNDNAIYYAFTTKSSINDNTEWFLYTGPFQISANAWITARCKSNRGVYGNAEHNFCEISVPSLTISSQDNIVTISKPVDYEYGIIYYQLRTVGSAIIIQEWREYTGPFSIDTSYNVECYGLKANGENGPRINKDIIFGVATPEISCLDNIVRITCSTPNLSRILYKIDDAVSWSGYTEPFVISDDCTITAVAEITDPYTGRTYSSEEVSVNCLYSSSGSSYVLHVPILKRYNDSNQIYVLYNNAGSIAWSRNDVKIFYKINSDSWKEYNAMFIYESDCTIQVYAEDTAGVRSDTATYSFEYDSSNPPEYVPAPVISVVKIYNYDYIRLESSDGGAGNLYYGFIYEDGRMNFPITYPGTETSMPGNISKVTIIGMMKRGTYYSEYSYYEYESGSGSEPVIIIPNPPTIRFNSSTHYVSIESSQYTSIKYSFDGSYFYTYTAPFELLSSETVYSYVIYNGQNSKTVHKYCEVIIDEPEDDEPSREYGLNDYLTFEMLEDGDIKFYGYDGHENESFEKLTRFTIYYSKNNGPWTEMRNLVIGSGGIVYDPGINAIISCSKGDIIRFKGDNATYHDWDRYYSGSAVIGYITVSEGYARFSCTVKHNICGNIMSLINSTSFSSLRSFSKDYIFDGLFARCRVVHLKELYLPATTLADHCYNGMFRWNVTGSWEGDPYVGVDNTMKSTPKSLPAATLTDYCYCAMFGDRKIITNGPTISATSLAISCCDSMFDGCSSLTVAPDLNARVGHYNSYYEMFRNCISLCHSKNMLESRVSNVGVDFNMYDGVLTRNGTLVVPPNSFILSNSSSSKAYKLRDDLDWTVITDSN